MWITELFPEIDEKTDEYEIEIPGTFSSRDLVVISSDIVYTANSLSAGVTPKFSVITNLTYLPLTLLNE